MIDLQVIGLERTRLLWARTDAIDSKGKYNASDKVSAGSISIRLDPSRLT